MRYFDAKKEGAMILHNAGIDEAEVDAECLLEQAAQIERSSLFVKLFEEMPEAEYREYISFIERRKNHEPLQYIIGSQNFMGYTFKVSDKVLIPRFDTEILAELAVKRCIEQAERMTASFGDDPGLSILDVCTGSGCVAVSVGLEVLKECKKRFGFEKMNHDIRERKFRISVTGTDISDSAVKLARENYVLNYPEASENHNTEFTGRMSDIGFECKFFISDLFEKIEGKYHVITANPPYIVREEIETLMPEITEHEPRIALDGGEDGLDFYRVICMEAVKYLHEDGRLLMEFDDSQAEPVKKMMLEAGFLEVEIHKDLAGLRRVIEGRV